MKDPSSVWLERLESFDRQLRSSTLLTLTFAGFLLNLVILDDWPFVDEIALGALVFLIARRQKRRQALPGPKPPAENVTPPEP